MREWVDRADGTQGADGVVEDGRGIVERLDDIESRLVATWQTTERGQMGTPLPKLAEALATLVSVAESADSAPTKSSYEVFDYLSTRVAREIDSLRDIIDRDVPAFVALLKENGVPDIRTD